MDYYLLLGLAIFAIILSSYAQFKVSHNYNKYSKIVANSGIVAKDLARRILDNAGLNDINIQSVKGTMTDYYNHKKKVIALSNGVMNASTIAGLGIMAHEVGHALQYQAGYFPIKLRNLTIKLSSVVSKLMWPMLIIGVILDVFIVMSIPVGLWLIYGALGIFSISTIVSLVTLPVEFDASRRALVLLEESGALDEYELQGAREVLSSAGLTYVAGFVASLVNLLRIIYIFTNNK